VIVAPLTKNIYRHKTNYILKKEKYHFLNCDSCIKTAQLRSVASIRMKKKIGQVDDKDLNSIKNRVKTLFNF
ncbi:type II toxin-antitoxin system PemK/MazF family toxin, partial [Lactococcus garvieae]|uniref:type II toxin-antitoxin system PemK/MazF family toxin n=1 Tax=Lactococcus garvieae TaxID=1363 RepID=UPI002549D832